LRARETPRPNNKSYSHNLPQTVRAFSAERPCPFIACPSNHPMGKECSSGKATVFAAAGISKGQRPFDGFWVLLATQKYHTRNASCGN